MPDPLKAFRHSPLKSGGAHPPVEAARQLVTDLYYDDTCRLVHQVTGKDARGAAVVSEVFSEPTPCHIRRIQNQRGAFTQGSTTSGGHGPVTSASVWVVVVPIGVGIEIGSIIEDSATNRYNVVAKDDAETWRTQDAFRVVRVGINQP